jgi:serine/threonine-protein kinase
VHLQEGPAASTSSRVRHCTRCRAIYRSDFLRCPTDGAEIVDSEDDPLVGTTLGEHYLIDACVGEGAMGRVYRAHHTRLQRRAFAVKVLLGDLATTLAMRLRFAQEAEAASGLDHPNVVTVIDVGRSEGGLLYLVMDFVDGELLSARIDRGPMAADEVVRLARAMAQGLQHAHERGLVHRDFKPDNVILADGVPRIVDFGLAITVEPSSESARLTGLGSAVGTPAYAAPEQASRGEADHRADLFALGVTMYEMLAGRLPFSGNHAEIMFQNATATPPELATRTPGVSVPRWLEALVLRLMAHAPGDRFASASDVVRALDRGPAEDAAVAPATRAARAAPDDPSTLETALGETMPLPVLREERDERDAPGAKVRRRWPIVAGVLGAVAIAAVLAVTQLGGRGGEASKTAATTAATASEPRAVAIDPDVAPTDPGRDVIASDTHAIMPDADAVMPDTHAVAPDTNTIDTDADAIAPSRDEATGSAPTTAPGPGSASTTTPSLPTTARVRAPHVTTPVRDARQTAEVRAPTTTAALARTASASLTPTTTAGEPGVRPSPTPSAPVVSPPPAPPPSTTASKPTPPPPPPPPATPTPTPPATAPAAVIAPARAPLVTTARVAIESLDVEGSLTAGQVRRVTERISGGLAGCYGPAATRANRSPATTVDVRLVLDEDGRARDVNAGGGALPGLASCVAGVVRGARSTDAPDVGTVRVAFTVVFRPEAP